MDVYQGFGQLLNQALSNIQTTRKGAEDQIKALKRQNENKFLTTLVFELLSEQNSPNAKQLASLLFKNTLINPTREDINDNLWQRQTPEMRENIKEALLSMLANTDFTVIKAAATCVAAIAVIELPQGQWPHFIDTLTKNSTSADINVRLASVQTLGFICEDIDPAVLNENDMNNILFSVLTNIASQEINLTRIAIKAFSRAAPITSKNFTVQEQKTFIMDNLFQAGKIDDEEVLTSLMEAMNDIVKVNYDYMKDYIEGIGNLTLMLLSSPHDKPATLAVEVWTTIAEVELQRNMQQKPTLNIIAGSFESIMHIIFTGFQKFDQNSQDEALDEIPENNISISAGFTLESISRVAGGNVLQPVLDFIQPKLQSSNWGDRYIGMIAFGSIIDGPDPNQICSIINDAFLGIIDMINDPVPKVRQTVSFVYYKLSEFVPQIIFQSESTLDHFMGRCLEHITEHHLISTLIFGALRNLYINAKNMGCSQILNKYFQTIFSKLVEAMYREDIHAANELQNVSDVINDITDSCDSDSLQPQLRDFLMAVLQELANSLDPTIFPLRLTTDQKENFQSFLGSLIQILIVKLRNEIDENLATNIVQLVVSLFETNRKVVHGGLLIIHALIIVLEKNFECFLGQLGSWIVGSIVNAEDENCGRFACGLVSDLSNYLEGNMKNYASNFMNCLNTVLSNSNYSTETKLHAMIAVGDICLAIESNFQSYFDETMLCLFNACQVTLQPAQNFESEEIITKLRDSIIDAFISIIHGMNGVAPLGSPLDLNIKKCATDILFYIDALLTRPNLETNEEFVKNIYELCLDITDYYGDSIRGQMRQMQCPAILRDGLSNFAYIPGMNEISQRFMTSMSRVGCV